MQFDQLRLYTKTTNKIRFDPSKKYMLLYFSENSTLDQDYARLNLRKQDFRTVVVPNTRIPRTYLNSEKARLYKAFGLRAISSNQKAPNRSFIFDLSDYLNTIDTTYNPNNYRQRAGYLIQNMLMRSFQIYDDSFEKIILYSIDRSKDFPKLVNMKVLPIINQLKDEDISFDHMLLGAMSEETVKYRLLVKYGDYNYKRIISLFRSIKPLKTEEEVQEDVEKESDEVSKKASNIVKVDPENRNKLKFALQSLFKVDEETYDKISSDEASESEIKQTIIKSVLYKVSGDLNRAETVANSIPKDKQDLALKRLRDQYLDEIIPSEKVQSTSMDISSQLYDIIGVVDGKNPSHIFNKRQIDFETNLQRDIENSFKVLETKEIPIKLKSVKIKEKTPKKGELEKTEKNIADVVLEDNYGNVHELKIDLPKIEPESGTFMVNGRRHCLVNQIIQCPITFPKPYMSKFHSSYSSFHIWSKRTKHLKYLEIYMGSYKLPFLPVLAYSFGFDNVMKDYNLKYEIKDSVSKDEYSVKISEDKFVVFTNVDSDLKQEIYQSLRQSKLTELETNYNFPQKEYFNDLIYYLSGRANATYLIQNTLDNIVDPIAKQVLINKQLPYKLNNIIYYMASKVVQGYTEDRNDLSNQRVRGSEVITELLQKQILGSYTEYREQVLAGNENAKINIKQDKTLKDFRNSEVVVDMEYANPIEEMAMMTRITPIGKSVSGIPDKRAVQGKALNVHDSYFGNVDPLDTPEGETIGITQQLTIDSALSSARGLFSIKDLNDGEASGLLSTSSSMIPFIENNDGARVIMSCNQMRQMLPLKNPENPIVQSGYESILPNMLSDAFKKKAPCNGKITSIEDQTIYITCDDGKKQEIDISPEHLRSGVGKNTLSTFRTKVSEGQKVKKDQLIAEGAGVQNGTISLGKNLLCAVMPYKGYNFEDGIVISDKLVEDESLTSLHGLTEEFEVNEKDKIDRLVEVGQDTEKGELLVRKTIGEMEELLGYQEEEDQEDFEIIGRQLTKKSPGGKVVDIEVFSNIPDSNEKFPNLTRLINKTDKKFGKPKGEKYTIRGETIKGILIKFKLEQELPIQVGDKLANRYGNKGIISLIEKKEKMPRTQDGEPVDIILNPLGIIGRMNVGQLFELYTGLISKELAKRTVRLKDRTKIISLYKNVLAELDSTKQKTFSSKYIKKLTSLSDKKFREFISEIESKNYAPIIIPPFKAPKHAQIYEAMRKLDLKTGYKLKLPEYNTETRSKVPIGYMYMSKLEHIGADKLHSRSTGPVTGKVLQPTAGKRKMGGQRVGEGDSYSLISYNAIHVLQEFFGPLSDDHATKNEMIADIVDGGEAEYREPKQNETKDLINAYFTALVLDK